MEGFRAIVSGKVQGVLYRDFVYRKARTLALRGFVRNSEGGKVEVVAQGPRVKLDSLIEHLWKGPFLATVSGIDLEWRDDLSEDLAYFQIMY
ncbi:acylphosphatase [Candidatus Kaiserbacteria bacterium CG10_big_fil_rev_8_21_14_0_10_49_17]|uniref:acylphosphatase n=1 Tax=Candidatus Kaiserbacteria bacterium CG10_big_fil_rev_8_21_14_0_10_49_17 TaxID=1974609 RepID=A0A2M6WDL0_9BACT|nr:MAG: acylphosphatase [Candidatus Kaiserbacteria bacterium CG10_big_fil_rev_8_21_14_0_10_49_17]